MVGFFVDEIDFIGYTKQMIQPAIEFTKLQTSTGEEKINSQDRAVKIIREKIIAKYDLRNVLKETNGSLVLDCVSRAYIEWKKSNVEISSQQFEYFIKIIQSIRSEYTEARSAGTIETNQLEIYLNDKYTNHELTNDVVQATAQEVAEYMQSLRIIQPKDFKLRVLNVNKYSQNDADTEYRAELSAIRGFLEDPEMKLVPHTTRYSDDYSELILYPDDAQKILKGNKTNLFKPEMGGVAKHEVFHTQKIMSYGWVGRFFEELCAEQASGNTQGYKELKLIWRDVSRLFGFDDSQILEAATRQDNPIEYIINTIEPVIGSLATIALLTHIPHNYKQTEEFKKEFGESSIGVGDMSKTLLCFFESKLGKEKIEAFIKARAESLIELTSKHDFFTAEEAIEIFYHKYGQKYLGDLIITKIREAVA